MINILFTYVLTSDVTLSNFLCFLGEPSTINPIQVALRSFRSSLIFNLSTDSFDFPPDQTQSSELIFFHRILTRSATRRKSTRYFSRVLFAFRNDSARGQTVATIKMLNENDGHRSCSTLVDTVLNVSRLFKIHASTL